MNLNVEHLSEILQDAEDWVEAKYGKHAGSYLRLDGKSAIFDVLEGSNLLAATVRYTPQIEGGVFSPQIIVTYHIPTKQGE